MYIEMRQGRDRQRDRVIRRQRDMKTRETGKQRYKEKEKDEPRTKINNKKNLLN